MKYAASIACTLGLFAASGGSAQIHDPVALAADPLLADGAIAPRLAGLGDHHFEVTTQSAESQAFFDQGLRLTYGFNHSEALRAFKEAARLDPDNAMAYWGWALVLGPNLNLPMQSGVVMQAHEAIGDAMELRAGASPRERAYIEALATRYSDDSLAERAPLDAAYAEAMKKLHEADPSDGDAATLYAAALMNLSPWNYWTRDGRPHERTTTILATLEAVSARNPDHPGAPHYYIHAVEAARPDLAVESADRLAVLMPGAGHMVHMPSHIYMRVGRYGDSYRANALAAQADEQYIVQCRAQGIYPLNYYPHNLHFIVWSALFQGRSKDALAAARKIEGRVPKDLEGNAFGAFETFLSQPLYVMVRFGLWDEVLAEPEPRAETPYLVGVWHYARGIALLERGKKRKAKAELAALRKLRDGFPAESTIGFGSASTLLTIADEVLAARLDAKAGRDEEALAHLERAVRLEDSLSYNEPPDWYFPVRHYLGAQLLDAGRPLEAEVVYWDDLARNRENGYALFGLVQSLEAQAKDEAAAAAKRRFEAAWRDADVKLQSSRF